MGSADRLGSGEHATWHSSATPLMNDVLLPTVPQQNDSAARATLWQHQGLPG